MSTLVIDGHPNPASLSAALAVAYAQAHGDAEVLALRDLDFDPHLHGGYTRRQELEPDLVAAWQAMLDAQHIVVVSPIWWGSVPVVLKGFFDRVLLPRRAYRYAPNGLPEGLLKGRTGRLIMTTDSPAWYLALTRNPAVRQVRNLTMRFCGLRTGRATVFGPVRTSDAARRERWVARAAELGHLDRARSANSGAAAAVDAGEAARAGASAASAQTPTRSASSS